MVETAAWKAANPDKVHEAGERRKARLREKNAPAIAERAAEVAARKADRKAAAEQRAARRAHRLATEGKAATAARRQARLDRELAEGRCCTSCAQTKPLEMFGRVKQSRSGYATACKACTSEKARLRMRPEQRAAQNERARLKRRENPEKQREVAKASRQRNRDAHLARLAKWARENPEKKRANDRAAAERQRLRMAADPEYAERIRQTERAARARRRQHPKIRLNHNVSRRVSDTLARGAKFGRRTYDLLGYSSAQLVAHLEKQFLPGMTWENYGEWHVDHIIPLAAFNFERPEDIDFCRAWALSNLQPLWAMDNIKKNASLAAPFQPSLLLAV
jgi:hypothetical protein